RASSRDKRRSSPLTARAAARRSGSSPPGAGSGKGAPAASLRRIGPARTATPGQREPGGVDHHAVDAGRAERPAVLGGGEPDDQAVGSLRGAVEPGAARTVAVGGRLEEREVGRVGDELAAPAAAEAIPDGHDLLLATRQIDDADLGAGDRLAAGRHHHAGVVDRRREIDRKSTRLNSSHVKISYAVFCLN